MNSTTATPLSEDQKWSILQQRILSAAPLFFYGVKTTGVYCRPGCSSRLPRRENVIFFDHTGAAQTAGFRACKKCQPDDWGTDQVQESKHVAAVLSACRMIQQAEKPPALDSIANAVA